MLGEGTERECLTSVRAVEGLKPARIRRLGVFTRDRMLREPVRKTAREIEL